ncbi:hypothetical protein BJ138DRAFT_1124095 [Hygrophoropsis aurantiaca]|uniref:Uncharacterized protein n=1 Tax=Hygrophoropsis aurantiaca TaxID=72124 RepID=A0ACB8AK17_9AGAM|nr:hypothetical protein BJ138DRAFT_1124095 [Hygrophoropsis aurantiaca]
MNMNTRTNCFMNSDLTDRILTNLDNFKTLGAAILASKSIHAAFRRRPRSILRAVAYNQIGPALPQALRLLRCERLQRRKKRPVTDVLENLRIHGELERPDISPHEIKSLSEKARVVQTLEDIFSNRMKDHRFKASQLTSVECLQFQRASYRIWLFSTLHGYQGCTIRRRKTRPKRRNFEFSDDDSNDGEDHEYTHQHLLLQKCFFDSFPTQDVKEICEVLVFMTNMARESEESGLMDYSSESVALEDVAMFHGPEAILSTTFGEADWSGDEDEDKIFAQHIRCFLVDVVSSVLADRGVFNPEKTIVDKMIMDKCKTCAADDIPPYALFNSSNWSSFFDDVDSDIDEICSELEDLTQILGIEYGHLLDEIFKLKTEAYANWKEEDWMCVECLTKLIKAHVHVWHLAQKQKDGSDISEDCSDGSDDSLQVQRDDVDDE